jgi:anti-sigma-K factor RskA
MMGLAFDNTCVLWQPLSCSDGSGSCAFYDSKALSTNFIIIFIVVKCASMVAMIFANVMYRPTETTEPDVVEVKANGDVDGGTEVHRREAAEASSVNGDTSVTPETRVWTVEGDSVVESNDKVNIGFVNDDDAKYLETSHL